MKDKLIATIVWIALGLGVAGFGIGIHTLSAPTSPQTQLAGSFNPTGGGTYLLQSSLSSTQNTITLTSFTEPGSGIPYTMSYIGTDILYGTIAPSSGRSEFISATGITQNLNGTATLTGVTRGESRTPGTGGCVASSTLAVAWPGQTQFILSNTPCFYSEYAARRDAQTISGLWTFTTPPVGINPGGSPNASVTVNGLVQLATARQAASSTVNGSTGAADVLQSAYATDTPQNCSTAANGSCAVMALLNGKISQLWLDLTQTFTFSGGATFTTATTTLSANTSIAATGAHPLALNGVFYNFPSVQGIANTFFRNDGAGNITSVNISGLLATSTTPTNIVSSAASTTVFSATVPANALNGGAVTATLHISSFALLNGDKLFICVLYGSSPNCLTVSNATGGGLSSTNGTFTLTLYGGPATSGQTAVETLITNTAGILTTAQQTTNVSNSGSISTDATSAQTLSIVARLSANSSSDIFDVSDYLATLNR